MADVKSGDLVTPGDQLCVIEELSPGYGTYEKDGIVFAATAGGVSIDLKDRSIRILEPNGTVRLSLPVQGDTLMGEVLNVYEQRAEVSLVKRNGKDILSPMAGEIHISNVTRRFVRSMSDVIRPGDIVRAVALNTHTIPVELGLIGPELGVLLGKCVKCGNDLTLTTYNNLICLHCEHRETREVTKDYGHMFGLEQRTDLAPRRRSYDDRREDRGRGGPGGRRDDRRYGSRDRRDGGGPRRDSRRRRD
ncbi:MAG: RNA-binding protein [Candidatus Thorarchaeota archaeon]|nr:RNA-binding protein [Candidatus Thorarchaeota archaeon]